MFSRRLYLIADRVNGNSSNERSGFWLRLNSRRNFNGQENHWLYQAASTSW
jgi:hypothetical protein